MTVMDVIIEMKLALARLELEATKSEKLRSLLNGDPDPEEDRAKGVFSTED